MNGLFSTVLKTIWRPTVNSVRTRYHADKQRLVRRFGYEEVYDLKGLLPRTDLQKRLPIPEYRPHNNWTVRRALFGQNDYIDILGTGEIHPVKTHYNIPKWIRGFQGNEYQVLLRKINWFSKTPKPFTRPTKWKEYLKRRSFLYKKLNRKVKTGKSKR